MCVCMNGTSAATPANFMSLHILAARKKARLAYKYARHKILYGRLHDATCTTHALISNRYTYKRRPRNISAPLNNNRTHTTHSSAGSMHRMMMRLAAVAVKRLQKAHIIKRILYDVRWCWEFSFYFPYLIFTGWIYSSICACGNICSIKYTKAV